MIQNLLHRQTIVSVAEKVGSNTLVPYPLVARALHQEMQLILNSIHITQLADPFPPVPDRMVIATEVQGSQPGTKQSGDVVLWCS
jgi:hypothetical protein